MTDAPPPDRPAPAKKAARRSSLRPGVNAVDAAVTTDPDLAAGKGNEKPSTRVKPAFDTKKFWDFCSHCTIETKDYGLIRVTPDRIMGTQRYFVEQVAAGINEGIHSFVALKGRQQGITTICVLIDLFWLFTHTGISGSLVSHTEEARNTFKTLIDGYIGSLPRRYKIVPSVSNRTEVVFKRNRSRIVYQVAGTRANSALGKGLALTFLHATEVSAYGDEEGMASLKASLAEKHPSRLFIYESTAQGFNFFEEMWSTAKTAVSEKAIFIGWWRKEDYSCKPDSKEYMTYWDGRIIPEERRWIRAVKNLYEFDITPEQIAWWRWTLNEKQGGNMQHMYQNYPPTEDYAFQQSGSNVFSTELLTEQTREMKAAVRNLKPDAMSEVDRMHIKPLTMRFMHGTRWVDLDVEECHEKSAELRVWEMPVPGAVYSIGADPAYGTSEWRDAFCATVWRCYGNRIKQVAEYCTPDVEGYQFAWILLYLAGTYSMVNMGGVPSGPPKKVSNTMLNLELNGPGIGILQELNRCKRDIAMIPTSRGDNPAMKMAPVLQSLENYLYGKPDSTGRPTSKHFVTSEKTKELAMESFNGAWHRGQSVIRSPGLIEEMKNVVRDGGTIGSPGRGKDDRVMAAALAHIQWSQYLSPRCSMLGLIDTTYDEGMGMSSLVQTRRRLPGFDPASADMRLQGLMRRMGIKF